MSPHQRVLTAAALTVKSLRIRSARAAAAGSGTVVLFQRRGARPRSPGAAQQPSHALTAVVVPGTAQRGVDAWCAVAALGHLVRLADLLGQRGVGDLPGRWGAESLGVVGGPGDLQQLARPLDVVLLCLLRLDERIDVHRVSFTKKAVARLRISTSSRSRRFSRRNADNSCRSVLVNPPSRRLPASRSAWRTHSRTAVSVRSKSRATCPIERSPCWHNSTISALNSGVNDRRARGFCVPWCP